MLVRRRSFLCSLKIPLFHEELPSAPVVVVKKARCLFAPSTVLLCARPSSVFNVAVPVPPMFFQSEHACMVSNVDWLLSDIVRLSHTIPGLHYCSWFEFPWQVSAKRKAPIESPDADEHIEYGPVCVQAATALFDGHRFPAEQFGITLPSSSQSRIVDHRDQAAAFARMFSTTPPKVCQSHVAADDEANHCKFERVSFASSRWNVCFFAYCNCSDLRCMVHMVFEA